MLFPLLTNLLRTNNAITLKKIRSKWKNKFKGKALNLIVVVEEISTKITSASGLDLVES
jgi:hypothetical protein